MHYPLACSPNRRHLSLAKYPSTLSKLSVLLFLRPSRQNEHAYSVLPPDGLTCLRPWSFQQSRPSIESPMIPRGTIFPSKNLLVVLSLSPPPFDRAEQQRLRYSRSAGSWSISIAAAAEYKQKRAFRPFDRSTEIPRSQRPSSRAKSNQIKSHAHSLFCLTKEREKEKE